MNVFARLAVLTFFSLSAAPAYATEACMPQTPEQFAVLKAEAELIVHVAITDYHEAAGNPHHADSWTQAEVLHTYKGDAGAARIKISGWTSYSQPLYVQERGSEAVLLLIRAGDAWRLADMSWKSCVPAVIGIPPAMDAAQKDAFIQSRLGAVE